MAQSLVELVKKHFPDSVLASHSQFGDDTVVLEPTAWHEVCAFLRDNPKSQMSMLTDLTAVDYPDREPRFEVVAHLYSLERGMRLRLKAQIGDKEGKVVEIQSLADLWGSANWMERECYDMMGVRFIGHPDLRRILLYPEFEGHPLRKDYPADRIQPLVPFREVPDIDKVAPFDRNEGMSFGRQTHDRARVGVNGEDEELFGVATTKPNPQAS